MNNTNGYLHLIIGPMFSGKTSRLIEFVRLYKILDKPILCIKPIIDNRYRNSEICSHNKETVTCICTNTNNGLPSLLETQIYKNSHVIFIEEGQFFEHLFVTVNKMVNEDKKHVYIAGLNGDCFRNNMGEISHLLCQADQIEMLTGVCKKCNNGTPGIFTKRTVDSDEAILIGGADMYEVVCRKHYSDNA